MEVFTCERKEQRYVRLWCTFNKFILWNDRPKINYVLREWEVKYKVMAIIWAPPVSTAGKWWGGARGGATPTSTTSSGPSLCRRQTFTSSKLEGVQVRRGHALLRRAGLQREGEDRKAKRKRETNGWEVTSHCPFCSSAGLRNNEWASRDRGVRRCASASATSAGDILHGHDVLDESWEGRKREWEKWETWRR